MSIQNTTSASIQLHVRKASCRLLRETVLLRKQRNRLDAIDIEGYEFRNRSVIALIHEAVCRHNVPDFPWIRINTGDRPICRSTRWQTFSFSTADGFTDIPCPDFLFDGWPQVGIPDYDATQKEMMKQGDYDAKTLLLGWLGNCDTHPNRWQAHAIGQTHPELMDIIHVGWKKVAGKTELESEKKNHLTMIQQVEKYQYLIDIEGRGWSGRLKLLLASGRPVFVQERPWREFFFEAMRPMEHYIPVRRDLSDLVSRLEWCHLNPAQAEAIGRAGQAFALSNLSRECAVAKWAEILSAHGNGPALPWCSWPRRWYVALALHLS